MYCFYNGKIIPEEKVGIPLDDIGILRGYACFDFLKTCNGKIFLFDAHWQKFQKSARFLNLKIPLPKEKLEEVIYQLIKKNKLNEVEIRMVITGGKTKEGLFFEKGKENFYIIIRKPSSIPDIYYRKGIKLKTYRFQRVLSAIKTNNYLEAVRLKNSILSKDIYDILYCNGNRVLECSTANFFIIKKDNLITPQKDVYQGVTRDLVLKLAKKFFKILEKDIFISQLKKADEAFITSTSRGIMPVTKIDNFKINQGKVGEKTKFLMKIFKEFTENY